MRARAIAGLGVLATAAYVVRRADHDYREKQRLGALTSAAGWCAYAAHGGLVIDAVRRRAWPVPPARRVGVTLTATGATLYLGGFAAFASLPLISGRSNERLVTRGVYRFSRHPQNVGWTLLLSGIGCLAGSGQAVALANALWLVFLPYARVEEAHLRRVHGAAYEDFATSTPRWLGPGRLSA